ncbi:MAG: CvpA family protein [Peptococcaceae bacterium]|nr:CvpA family protein [Peptococcaceae bacterium]
MSIWDILIIALLFLAIFRGYFKGMCKRLSGWVGLVLSFIISLFNTYRINDFITNTFHVSGKEKIREWLEVYFNARVASNPDNQLESLKQWVADIYLPSAMKENLYNAIDESASQIYGSIYAQVARILATPVWHVILCILGTMVIFALCVLIGELSGLLVERFYVTRIIDRFIGALFSGIFAVVVVGIFTALLVFIVPEDAGTLGRILHNSFMAPTFMQAVDAFIKGGFIF